MSHRKLILLAALFTALAQCLSGCAGEPPKIATAHYRMEEILTTGNGTVLRKVYSEHDEDRTYRRVAASAGAPPNVAVVALEAFALNSTYSLPQDGSHQPTRQVETIVLLSDGAAWEKVNGKWKQAPVSALTMERKSRRQILDDAKLDMQKFEDDGMVKFNGRDAHSYSKYRYGYVYRDAYTRFYLDKTGQLIGKEIVEPGLRYVATITYDDSIRVQAPAAR
jgi:hypothetical protein